LLRGGIIACDILGEMRWGVNPTIHEIAITMATFSLWMKKNPQKGLLQSEGEKGK